LILFLTVSFYLGLFASTLNKYSTFWPSIFAFLFLKIFYLSLYSELPDRIEDTC